MMPKKKKRGKRKPPKIKKAKKALPKAPSPIVQAMAGAQY